MLALSSPTPSRKPLRNESTTTTTPPTTTTKKRTLPRILLIDDDASLLDALSIAFEDAGHEVLTALDGARGLERVRADRPDAVVSDVNMPGLDGLTLCRKLR